MPIHIHLGSRESTRHPGNKICACGGASDDAGSCGFRMVGFRMVGRDAVGKDDGSCCFGFCAGRAAGASDDGSCCCGFSQVVLAVASDGLCCFGCAMGSAAAASESLRSGRWVVLLSAFILDSVTAARPTAKLCAKAYDASSGPNVANAAEALKCIPVTSAVRLIGNSLIYSWVPMALHWRSMGPMGIKMASPWAPMGCPWQPMAFPWARMGSYELPWAPHGLPMGTAPGKPLCTHHKFLHEDLRYD